MERALQTFEVSALRRWFSNTTGWEFQDTPLAFEGRVLNVCRPVEPTEMQWHTSHVRLPERVVRILVSFALTAALIACFVLAATQMTGGALPAFVTIVNTLLPQLLKGISGMVEIHREYGDEQDSMFLKLLGARVANTGIAAFVSFNARERGTKEALDQVMVILILDAFFLPLIRALDPYDLFVRRVAGPQQPTQRAMNRFWSGAEWTIAERYTDVAKTLFVGMFYAAAVPVGLWLTAASMLVNFLVDHYCLLRLWGRKPDFDDQISRRFIGVVSIIVLVHVVATQSFFQNWGVFPRSMDIGGDDEQSFKDPPGYDKDEFGQTSMCWGVNGRDAFKCRKPQDKRLTNPQHVANDIYPVLGWIALIVALWRFVGVVIYNYFWYTLAARNASLR